MPHLLVPFAACSAAACQAALQGLALPGLRALVTRLAPGATDAGTPEDLTPPHERVLARARGLWQGDGRIADAAWRLRHEGHDPGTAAWAWLTPCHWAVGRDRIRMAPPHTLQLQEAASRELLEAIRPYAAEDGIDLHYRGPTRWLASGEMFRGLACASLDRAAGGTVDDWLPRSPEARTLRRLQQEVQMLLYTHPVNDAREAQGLVPVNSFWVSGAGALPAGALMAEGPQVHDALREPALAGDWAAWRERWQALDADVLAPVARALDRNDPISLTLCGVALARTWGPARAGWAGRLSRLFGRAPSAAQLLDSP
ncbi:phosphoglycerate mutase [Ramlibacter sp. AW1]|uniref:Phosphoglycerate mutase n=1 Tax=Ramlibacter aurantiacus TaxID=2801330 RepID=A0A936ZNW7_9BURK|nr:phosphoglycerate mutase [Ramlibacter aurantiacus]MBL0420768.1 phosphoglycerate mutase [Ramlibacter aurantiacus]